MELGPLFPNLWGSPKAAERWLAKTPHRHIEILLGFGGFLTLIALRARRAGHGAGAARGRSGVGAGGGVGGSGGGYSGEGPRRVGEALPAPDPEAVLHGDCGERSRWVVSRPSLEAMVNDEVAPITAVRRAPMEPRGSTGSGRLPPARSGQKARRCVNKRGSLSRTGPRAGLKARRGDIPHNATAVCCRSADDVPWRGQDRRVGCTPFACCFRDRSFDFAFPLVRARLICVNAALLRVTRMGRQVNSASIAL
jgi:hypothetical protein